jgi:hypothetical protein
MKQTLFRASQLLLRKRAKRLHTSILTLAAIRTRNLGM